MSGKSSYHSRWLLLTTYSYTIIDEADEMLSSDWEEEMAKIMSGGGMQHTCTYFENNN